MADPRTLSYEQVSFILKFDLQLNLIKDRQILLVGGWNNSNRSYESEPEID